MGSLSIRTKLILLAGVPVIGALILAAIIARGARQQAAAAEALGSVEDVAQLSVRIGTALHAVQMERARAAYSEGAFANTNGEVTVAQGTLRSLAAQARDTDTALSELEHFLSARDLSKLPSRLAKDLASARERTNKRAEFRKRLLETAVPLDDVLSFYGSAADALISATAALTQLSDDGELLRRITSLVALSELAERESREHAVLAYAFAATEFPPGSFKTLVTLVTEQDIYSNQFRTNASDAHATAYDKAEQTPNAVAAIKMRQNALATTDDVLAFNAAEWFDVEADRLYHLEVIADGITHAISQAATAKVASIRASIRMSFALSAAVVLASALLAWTIAGGITRTVKSLSGAAGKVRQTKDYGVRATKLSTDELGMLTDAFNEMLGDIQARDHELQEHRENLEKLVAERTAEVVARNEAMRMVLDNVDQGLATIHTDGTLDSERSASFDHLFGSPRGEVSFGAHLAAGNPRTAAHLDLSWEQVVEDILPRELTLDQMPKRLDRDGKHFTLQYKPIEHDGKLHGALLIASDVTAEVEARKEQERQREYVAVFERTMNDREGFAEFAADTNHMIERLASGTGRDETLRLVHTIKGNAAQWGVSSVARLAHELESALVANEPLSGEDPFEPLFTAWQSVTQRFSALCEGSTRLAVTRDEMDQVLIDVRAKLPHAELYKRLERLKHEPAAARFERMIPEIERLAERVGKPRPEVVVDAHGVRLPATRFASFWQSMVHVLRNVVDHGIEPAEQRLALGKPAAGKVTLRASSSPDQFRIEIADDGRGIDWDKLKSAAEAKGLPTAAHQDLVHALFAAGVSTATAVSDISGRGVGLSAVQERCQALGGTIKVETTPGKGTSFVFVFPRGTNEHSIIPSAHASPARLVVN